MHIGPYTSRRNSLQHFSPLSLLFTPSEQLKSPPARSVTEDASRQGPCTPRAGLRTEALLAWVGQGRAELAIGRSAESLGSWELLRHNHAKSGNTPYSPHKLLLVTRSESKLGLIFSRISISWLLLWQAHVLSAAGQVDVIASSPVFRLHGLRLHCQ